MILADTSVWIDCFRRADADFGHLLLSSQVLAHPHVLGEIALGGLKPQSFEMRILLELPPATLVSDEEVLRMINNEQMAGLGVGYVDCHLLASVRLTRDAKLWTHDRKLYALAARLGVNRPMTAH